MNEVKLPNLRNYDEERKARIDAILRRVHQQLKDTDDLSAELDQHKATTPLRSPNDKRT